MNATRGEHIGNGIVEILRQIRGKGVRLWSQNGELHYKAPRGALSREEIAKLTALSKHIVAMLDESTAGQHDVPKLERRQQWERVPLTFSQFKYWHSDRLSERPTIRSVTSATRLYGQLDMRVLRASLMEVVRRHEALRTRVVVVDACPSQRIDEHCSCELAFDDLIGLSESAGRTALECMIHQLILEPIDVSVGPLFEARLARVREDQHVLIVAMEHIISDGFSIKVLLRDLFAVYQQLANGGTPILPPVPIQLSDYAVWQEKAHESWMERHWVYWKERLAGCGRLRFPPDERSPSPRHARWSTVPVQIDADTKARLREWCRLRRTTVVMSMFTTFVALVLRWCNASTGVIRYQTDGRLHPLLQDAVGYFAAVLNLRIDLLDGDTLLDLLDKVTQEYCAAHEHADFSFVDAQVPRPEFTRNAAFNWIPKEAPSFSAQGAGTVSHEMLVCRPEPFTYPVPSNGVEWDYEPSIALYDRDAGIDGTIVFSTRQFSTATMEDFRDSFLLVLSCLLTKPDRRVGDLQLR